MYLPSIGKDEINILPVARFEGKVNLITSADQVSSVFQEMQNSSVLGFDTETRPSFKKGRKNKVALLQLATDENAWLFRLDIVGLPTKILRILENPGIVKVGVAIRDDLIKIKEIRKFAPEGFIELADFVKKYDIQDNGLRKLAANILKIKISKSQQLSNWEALEYSPSQIQYAATDAWACFEIFQQLRVYGNE
jgi:ribonuclease D